MTLLETYTERHALRETIDFHKEQGEKWLTQFNNESGLHKEFTAQHCQLMCQSHKAKQVDAEMKLHELNK